MNKERPDHDTMVRTMLREDTGWDYRFDPGLVTAGVLKWTEHDWIRLIGDNWFRKPGRVPA